MAAWRSNGLVNVKSGLLFEGRKPDDLPCAGVPERPIRANDAETIEKQAGKTAAVREE
jgi:hypothetical protein